MKAPIKVHFINPVVSVNEKYTSLPRHGDTKALEIEEGDGFIFFPTLGLKVFASNILCLTYEVEPKPVETKKPVYNFQKKKAVPEVDTDPGKIAAT
jgi:hypothetical protein